MASATAAVAATSAAITAAITTPVAATAVTLAAAISTTVGAWRVTLRGIVVGRKILRRGGVGFGLALVEVVGIVVDFGGVRISDFAFGSRLISDAGLFVVREGFVMRIVARFVM
jgi:hypothetical protein